MWILTKTRFSANWKFTKYYWTYILQPKLLLVYKWKIKIVENVLCDFGVCPDWRILPGDPSITDWSCPMAGTNPTNSFHTPLPDTLAAPACHTPPSKMRISSLVYISHPRRSLPGPRHKVGMSPIKALHPSSFHCCQPQDPSHVIVLPSLLALCARLGARPLVFVDG